MRLDESQKRKLEKLAQTPYQQRMETGPVVIINPYKDLYKKKEEAACPEVKPEKKQKKFKRPFSLSKDWLSFSEGELDKIAKRVDSDIYQDFWSRQHPYKGKVNPILLSHIHYYKGKFTGRLKNRKSKESSVSFELNINKGSKNGNVNATVNIVASKNTFWIKNLVLKGFHPTSHSNTPGGYCRGLILKSIDKDFEIHISKLRNSNSEFVAKVYIQEYNNYSKERQLIFLSSMYLKKENQIKNLVEGGYH